MLISRDPNAISTLALAGWSFCIAPAIDVVNKRLSLYLHFGTYAIYNTKYGCGTGIYGVVIRRYLMKLEMNQQILTWLKPGEWKVYKIEVTVYLKG